MARQSFTRNVPGAEPATYQQTGVQQAPDTSMNALIGGVDMIGGAIKTGVGLQMGEDVMNRTMDEYVGAGAEQQPEGATQSIGLDGTITQFDTEGNQLGSSGQINPELSGEARNRAIEESTAKFNQQASKVKRAYETGAISDREFRARLEMNLKESVNANPAFQDEIRQQAQRVLSDGLFYYHYQSAVSGMEAARKKREAAATEAAEMQQKLRLDESKKIATALKVPTSVVYENPQQFYGAYAQLGELDRQKQQIELQSSEATLTSKQQKMLTGRADRVASQTAAFSSFNAYNTAVGTAKDLLGVDSAVQVGTAIANADAQTKDQLRATLEEQKRSEILDYESNFAGVASPELLQNQIERIESNYDSVIQNIDEPAIYSDWQKMAQAKQDLAALNTPPEVDRVLNVLPSLSNLPNTVQMQVLSGLEMEDVSGSVAAWVQGNPVPTIGGENLGSLNTTTSTFTDAALGELGTSSPGKSPQRKEQQGEVAKNGLSAETEQVSQMIEEGSADSVSSTRNLITKINKAQSIDPALLENVDKEKLLSVTDHFLTSAASRHKQFVNTGKTVGITVNPNTGLIQPVGDRSGYDEEATTRTTTSIQRNERLTRGQKYVRDLNRAVSAKATAMGDTSLQNKRVISNQIVSMVEASVGDTNGTKKYAQGLAPAYGVDPALAARMAQNELKYNTQIEGSNQLPRYIRSGIATMKESLAEIETLDPEAEDVEKTAYAAAVNYDRITGNDGDTERFLSGDMAAFPQGKRDYINDVVGRGNSDNLLLNIKGRVEGKKPMASDNSITVEESGDVDVRGILQQSAQEFGLDPDFVTSVAMQESRLDPSAVSPVGAGGVMQLMPTTAKARGLTDEERFDPEKGTRAGVEHLKIVTDRVGKLTGASGTDQQVLALAFYNWGDGNVMKYLKGEIDEVPQETKDYIAKILPGQSWEVLDKYRRG